jgi:hypothetical protein
MSKRKQTDWLIERNANVLLQKIAKYWRRRNKEVALRLVRIGKNDPPIYSIRSDMKNGKPQRDLQ